MNQFHIRAATYKESRGDYIDRLMSLDLMLIGWGSFAAVFDHPTSPGVAVKIFEDSDQGYWFYLKWCQKHQSNRYVPKIIEVANQEDFEPDSIPNDFNYTIVFMEKLRPSTPSMEKDVLSELPPSITNQSLSRFKGATRGFWESVSKQTKDLDLAEFARFLISAASKGFNFDLKSINILSRRDGHLVFVDPLQGH